MDIKQKILAYALQNAIKFDGKANQGAVIGKLIADDPSVKNKMKEISKDISAAIKEISKLSVEKQRAKLMELAPELLEEKKHEEREGLAPLKDAVKGKVVMRVAPSPSGPLHIGHSLVVDVNSEYCRMYGGKFILRIEDTNPENIDPVAYEMIPEETNWLTGNNVSQVVVQSDRMKLYYDYAEKLIDKNAVYVCTCDPDEYKEKLGRSEACPCRELPKKEQMARWKKMFKGYKEGEAVVRVKTDINDKNPAMRDFPIARINDAEHPRQGTKYRVWPLMNLSVFVDDVELGMTHTIRGKDHADNAKRQEYLYRHLGKKPPINLFQGRINFTDMEVSCSKTKKKIIAGEYSGWDDIRLPFIAALRKRGYQPGAFMKWAVSLGVSPVDKTVSKEEFFKVINSNNKEILDPVSKRYFFIDSPVKIKIDKCPKVDVELDLHPENKKGGRKFKINGEFYVAKEDLDKFKDGKLVRLMDCLNFVVKGKKFVFDSLEYEKYKDKGSAIIHWLPVSSKNADVSVLMPDKTLRKGIAEPLVSSLKVSDIIQFERTGFCRLDSNKDGKMVFWFGHR